VLDRAARDARHLAGLADQLAVAAAVDEQAVGMCLLEEARPDLHARDVRGDREHRRAGAMGVVQALDQVCIPRPAASRAHRQAPGQLRLGSRGEGTRLLVADVNPIDPVRSPDGVHDRIQAVADHAIDALDSGFQQNLDQLICKRCATHLELLCGLTGVPTPAPG
jgi:hypothetical protein